MFTFLWITEFFRTSEVAEIFNGPLLALTILRYCVVKDNSQNRMGKKGMISKQIEFFYSKFSEETRLDKGMGVFEFERIKSLIDRY